MAKMQLIAGRAHPNLAKKISKFLGLPLTLTKIKTFADGEIYVKIEEKVRGDDIFIIQPTPPPVNENLMELLITIDALKRASTDRINVISPYLGYSRQERKVTSREPISAKLIANMISTAGANRLMSIDLHADAIQGFYDIPVNHFVGYPQFAKYFQKKGYKDLVIVSPDVGSAPTSRKMAGLLDIPFAVIDKRRVEHNKAETTTLIGNVKNKNCIINDDMIDTGGTVTSACKMLKKHGAKNIYICATHGLLSGPAVQRLKKCPADEVLLLDTVPLPKEKRIDKIKIISISSLLAKVIKRIHEGESLGKLFTWEKKIVNL
jgi:ribose-phosphate pyrophosphokinase